ncbi:AraC family transcriptional regulator [Rhizobium sp. LjRoot30]|uniref:helix-turn-helix domain-containing protein n=1 Tax=Rhizobium sp. LjRoot30 TaxID=3342320 RepID=UPI003ECDDFC7
MTFLPQMQNRISGFSVKKGPRRLSWNGIVADLWDVECAPGAGGYYVGRDPRLFIALEAEGDRSAKFTLSERSDHVPTAYLPPCISYIPADMELWGYADNIRFVRHLDLHINVETLQRRLMEDLDRSSLDDPRLMFKDERILSLARLIAAECDNPDPLHELYGDGLAMAMIIDLLKLGRKKERKRTQLAAWQLKRAVDFIEAHCLQRIRLGELAELTNLSQSHFSHAFKASTGMPPHQWQMQARIERVKTLLQRPDLSLTAVAMMAGFSDQAHFTRVFRKMVGVTPLAFQRRLAD